VSKQTFVAFGVASAIAFATLSISLPASAQMGREVVTVRNDGWTRLWPRHDGSWLWSGMMGNYGPGMMGGCPMPGTTTDGQVSTFTEGPCRLPQSGVGHY